MSKLYVLVLDGAGPRKIHAPDCGRVEAILSTGQPRKRRYELRPAGSVAGEACRACGGAPGRNTGRWPVRD